MNYWHMQLHPNENDSWSIEDILHMVRDIGVIGLGESWDNDQDQPEHFRSEAEIGDVVLIRHHGPLCLVEITSDCIKNEGKNAITDIWFPIYRYVSILSLDANPMKDSFTKEFGEVWSKGIFAMATFQNANNWKFIKYWYNKCKKDMMLKDYIATLLSCNNIILTGAPGTGKTYLAKQIASKLILSEDYSEEVEQNKLFKNHVGFVQFHPSYDYSDFVEGLRPIDKGDFVVGFKRKDGVFKEFCKSAIEIDSCLKYLIESEELLETKGDSPVNFKISEIVNETISIHTQNDNNYIIGYCVLKDALKSNEEISQIWFENYLTNNQIKLFDDQRNDFISHYYFSIYCKIKKYNDSPFVFIIDEINRGEMSKIFGELFFSIDPGYRGKAGLVMTQYQNLIEPTDTFFEGFYVPKNVYIIGTMNDIDRSVESMDFAMRRRFAFMEILADKNTSMLDSIKEKTDVIAKMNAINQLISAEEELGSSYHIGGAYFKKVDLCRNENGEINWNTFWDRYLYRLIYEYVRGFQNRQELLGRMRDAIVPQKKDSDNSIKE